jgi:hypothetical protein
VSGSTLKLIVTHVRTAGRSSIAPSISVLTVHAKTVPRRTVMKWKVLNEDGRLLGFVEADSKIQALYLAKKSCGPRVKVQLLTYLDKI